MVVRLAPEVIRAGAIRAGVCVRPIVRKLIDTETGESRLVPIPCGTTRETVCPPCADKARRLRMQQCREGWHLEDDPLPPEPEPVTPADTDDDADGGAGDGDENETARRVRSTRRRQDAPDLPRLPVAHTSVGKAFQAKDGKVWRPSMFVTFTLPSYGRVRSDGSPVDPASYDYRRAALDALHFSALWDRLTQNLRRSVGYKVQYFAAIEPQRRLAPHLHAAIRGAIPRKLLRQVIAATYHQVWWPPHDTPVYVHELPAWDERTAAYVDPRTGHPLPTWDQALDQLGADPDAEPAHVVRFGTQTDVQGLIAGSPDADRRIGYLTKYLTKNIADPAADDATSAAREAHIDRLHAELIWLPCSPKCANWLRYGVQPKDAEPGMRPGRCDSKTHTREHLGVGGRRVLVSRYWTGKTLTEHRADRIGAVRTVLEAAGTTMHDTNRYAASSATRDDGRQRFVWETVDLDDLPTYTRVISQTISERNRWRQQYEAAKRAGPPDGPVDNSLGNSAIGDHQVEEVA